MLPKDHRTIELILVMLAAFLINATWLFFDISFPNIDTVTHYRWATQFAQDLGNGIFIPRWTPLSRSGLGEPAFLYYPPLFFYLVAVVDLVANDTWLSIKVVVQVTTVAIGLSAWLVFRRSREPRIALIIAIVLMASPMLFGVRGMINAYPWYLATVPLIWFVHFSVEDFERGKFFDLRIATSLTLVVLCHTLSGFVAILCAGSGLAIYAFLSHSTSRSINQLFVWAISCGLGLLLSGYYLVPALAEMSLINVDGWRGAGTVNWSNTFALPLLTDGWLASLHWFVPFTVYALFLACALYVFRKHEDGGIQPHVHKLLLIALTALFFASEASYPLWALFDSLSLLQRPFRFLPLATIATVLAAGLLVPSIPQSLRRLVIISAALIFVAPMIALQAWNPTFLRSYDGVHLDIGPHRLTEEFYLPEYSVTDTAAGWIAYLRQGGFEAEASRLDITVRRSSDSSLDRRWIVEATESVGVRFPLYAFPAWQVKVNDVNQQGIADPDTGLLTILLSPGRSEIVVRWVRLPSERIGLGMSVLGLLILLVLYFRSRHALKGSANLSTP
jgi:hypothetical protein